MKLFFSCCALIALFSSLILLLVHVRTFAFKFKFAWNLFACVNKTQGFMLSHLVVHLKFLYNYLLITDN